MSSTYRKVSEVVAALVQRYDGPTKELDGFTYIPWQESAKKLDEVFGPFGYDILPHSSEAHPREGIYTASVIVVGRATDDETGEVVTLQRAGFGRATAQASKKEREEEGLTVTKSLKAHDTAAAAAASDALSRGAKLLGDAFGRFLYDEKTSNGSGASSSYSTGASRTRSDSARRGPSAGQSSWLKKLGFTQDEIDGMEFKAWRGVLDAAGKGEPLPVQPASKQHGGRSFTQDNEPDDIPF